MLVNHQVNSVLAVVIIATVGICMTASIVHAISITFVSNETVVILP